MVLAHPQLSRSPCPFVSKHASPCTIAQLRDLANSEFIDKLDDILAAGQDDESCDVEHKQTLELLCYALSYGGIAFEKTAAGVGGFLDSRCVRWGHPERTPSRCTPTRIWSPSTTRNKQPPLGASSCPH